MFIVSTKLDILPKIAASFNMLLTCSKKSFKKTKLTESQKSSLAINIGYA